MDICVIGAGYVGLTTAAVLAQLGHHVTCVDINEERIHKLQNGKVPIYEPGLKELILNNHDRLRFSSEVTDHIREAPIVMIAVGTPSLPDGKTNLTYVYSVVDMIAESITSYKTIITKSTVPPGTNEAIYNQLTKKGINPEHFNVVSNPEFLREGSAIYDMENPDRIVVGLRKDDKKSAKIVKDMYQGLDAPIIETSLSGAEMIKYASNAFLATKISFINEMAKICDQYNVNVDDVSKGIGLDARIGPHFLQAGLGYGGSCFPKDVWSLEQSALEKGVDPKILKAVQQVNADQVDVYINKLQKAMPNLKGKKITVLGIAFKPNTDDIRCSPAVELIQKLSESDCDVHTYDPKAHLPSFLQGQAFQHATLKQAIMNADCVIIATDWKEIKEFDLKTMRSIMKGNIIVDTRNCLDSEVVRELGLQYVGVGRP